MAGAYRRDERTARYLTNRSICGTLVNENGEVRFVSKRDRCICSACKLPT